MVVEEGIIAGGTFTANGNFHRYGTMPALVEGCTDVAVRFSLSNNGCGSRVERHLAVKFHDGQWDLLTSNMPVSFIRNCRYPQANLCASTREQCWLQWTKSPETLHIVTMLMSERGIPASYRQMHGYSVGIFVVGDKKQTYVKFHLKSDQGIATLTDDQVGSLATIERDSCRELATAIEAGRFPSWRLCMQIASADSVDLLLDTTKVWSQKTYPLIELGILKLTSCDGERNKVVVEPLKTGLAFAAGNQDKSRVDDFAQVGNFFRILSPRHRQALFDNTARSLYGLSSDIKLRHTMNCLGADIAYGQGIANALGIPLSRLED